ncbi:MAG TPA: helix-turn-helix transcriptional regulator [Pirellulales bacterium]|nr:helix-turn-helix transcriptional regulator [Pirellulales bacterium]
MIRKNPNAADHRMLDSPARWQAKLASEIQKARIAAGLSRLDLARKTRVRPSTIANLEDPDYRHQSLSLLERVAQCLGLRLNVELAADEPDETEELAAAERLKTSTPPNDEMLRWSETSEIPPETNDDTDEEPPW